MDDSFAPPFRLFLALAFLAVVAGGVIDLILDRPPSWRSAHVLFEVVLIAFSLGLAGYLWVSWYRAARSLAEARHLLATRQEERDRWRHSAQTALEGLARAIDAQFAAWDLTPAEREVATLVLRGLGHKQIAAQTGRSERTVRQHAVAVYRKSALNGRAELAAFFLGALPLPTLPASAPSEPHARSPSTPGRSVR